MIRVRLATSIIICTAALTLAIGCSPQGTSDGHAEVDLVVAAP